jgi:hypothetical protein
MKHALLVFALAAIRDPRVAVTDAEGVTRRPLWPERWGVLFFVTTDCPIANAYAPEIRRVCEEYASKGVACSLVYADPTLADQAVLAHAREFAHGAYPRMVDREHRLIKATGAKVTPEAALIGAGGKLLYRGRIDDSFLIPGQSRRRVSRPDLRNALDAVIAGRPVPVRETRAVGCVIPDPRLARP